MPNDTTPAKSGNKMLADALSTTSDPYFAAFGRFIVEFSRAEHAVRLFLLELLEINEAEGAALFHSWGLKDLKDGVQKLLISRDKADKYEAIKEGFEQFSHIAQVRNALEHWTGRSSGFVSLPHTVHDRFNPVLVSHWIKPNGEENRNVKRHHSLLGY